MNDIKTDDLSDVNNNFWNAMDDIGAGMLGLEGDYLVPMSPKLRDDVRDGIIWFITAEGTDLQKQTATGPKTAQLVVGEHGAGLWADIRGTLEQVTDPAVVDDIWSAMMGVWFEDGKADPDVRLMAFTPKTAEATINDDTAVGFFYKIAKAKVTGDKPEEMGWQGKLTF